MEKLVSPFYYSTVRRLIQHFFRKIIRLYIATAKTSQAVRKHVLISASLCPPGRMAGARVHGVFAIKRLEKDRLFLYNVCVPISRHIRSASSDRADALQAAGIRESDVVEKFVRSGGKGGQHVNKTSTCVYLKHLPTGIEVKCGAERSQRRNRLAALHLLAEKVMALAERKRRDAAAAAEKARRRARPRPKALKERILDGKRRTAAKKRMRAPSNEE